jgi:hypothetical protein
MRPWFTGGNSALSPKRASFAIVAFAVALIAITSVIVSMGQPTQAVALGSLPKMSLDNAILRQVTPTVTPTATPGLPLTGFLQVSDTTPTRGQTITVSGGGYRANTDVRITIHSHISLLGTARTGIGGAFSANIRIPTDAHLGIHTLRATGDNPRGDTRVLSATIDVQDVTATSRALPKTGPAIAVALGTIASALLIVGHVLRGWSSQKRHPSNLPRV